MRTSRGTIAEMSGRMAEDAVRRHYLRAGCELLAHRWRGQAGEIDLIFRLRALILFVEVKAGATHEAAARRIGSQQIARIAAAATEFCATLPDGQLTEMRLDAALVDAAGRVEVIENAFC